MIGLLVLGTLVLWFFVARGIARRLARAVPMKAAVRPWASVGLFVVVFLLPVADELAAKPYFTALCRNAVFRINAAQIKGRKVTETVDPSNEVVARAPVVILHSHFWYRNFATRELLGEYEIYRGHGGALATLLPFTGTPPLTGPLLCAPERVPPVAEQYSFTIVD
jgi:hypothetical protein